MAEMVGVEPTRPCGPIAFRVRPLQPLEYISRIVLPNSNIVLQLNENGKEYLDFWKNNDQSCVYIANLHIMQYTVNSVRKKESGASFTFE